jgi:hypothetical protein
VQQYGSFRVAFVPEGLNAPPAGVSGGLEACGTINAVGAGGLVVDTCTPTAVMLASFRALRQAKGVQLRWRTATEVGLLGFNVYRGTVKLNRALIHAKARAGGAAYGFAVRPGRAGAYRLQAVGIDGSKRWVGTASAT